MGAPGCSLTWPNRLQRHDPIHQVLPLKSFIIRSYADRPKTPFASPLESAFTDTPSSKPFIIRFYENTGGYTPKHLRDTAVSPACSANLGELTLARSCRGASALSCFGLHALFCPNGSTPVFSGYCGLFCTTPKANCLVFTRLQPLSEKEGGVFSTRQLSCGKRSGLQSAAKTRRRAPNEGQHPQSQLRNCPIRRQNICNSSFKQFYLLSSRAVPDCSQDTLACARRRLGGRARSVDARK
jgi:hypothetical protein